MTERAGLECVPLLAPASDRGSLGLQCKTRPGPAGGWPGRAAVYSSAVLQRTVCRGYNTTHWARCGLVMGCGLLG